jgi:hypothetical protein
MTGQFLTPRAWRGYRMAEFPLGSWGVEEECLRAFAGREPISLISREPYGDFDLTLEWRLPVGGNSGILYRVTEDGEQAWQSGPEMQLLHDAGHPDGRVPETSCGALYGVMAAHAVPLCSPGIFNVARVSIRGSDVEHWLNGVCVLRCDMASEDFRRRVSHSKFRDCPQYARAASGHIVLQHHGGDAWFTDIRIDVPSHADRPVAGAASRPRP